MGEAEEWETLTPDDAVYLVEQLLPTPISSRELGLQLGLPKKVINHIHSTFSEPEDCIFHVLIEFTSQSKSRPTWKVFRDTLRRPEIGLPALAETLEATVPDPDVPQMARRQMAAPPPKLSASSGKLR